MSMFSDWAKKHLAIRFDKDTLGNLTKNVAPVAGALVGGPAGLALGAGLGAGGEALRGKTGIGDLLKAGLSNAALAGGGEAALSHFGGSAAEDAAQKAAEDSFYASTPGSATYAGATAPGGIDLSQLGGQGASGGSGITPLPNALKTLDGQPPSSLAGNLTGGVPNVAQTVTSGIPQESKLGALGGWAAKNALPIGQAAAGVLGARQQSAQTGLEQQQLNLTQQQYADLQKRRAATSQMLQQLFANGGPQRAGNALPTSQIPTSQLG